MMRAHQVRIRKARGGRAFVLLVTGRGLWTVTCTACPAVEFPTYRSHDQAVTVAAAHLGTWPGSGVLSTDIDLDPETAARIRARVMEYAQHLDRARPQIFRAGEAREGVSSNSEQDDFR